MSPLNPKQRQFAHVLVIFMVFLTAISFCSKSIAQSLVNSTGATIQNNSISVEYSIGEIGITTLSGNNRLVTQGLLQPIFLFKDCDLLHLIPTAFTPNRDNMNDYFGVKYWPAATSFELSVYSRWGQLVFKTSNYLEHWNGDYNGQPQPTGTYVYFINANTTACGVIATKGTVTLIR